MAVDLSVVMPVFNEERALPGVLDEALAALKDSRFTYEILLVNDASTDGTLRRWSVPALK